MRGFFIAPQKNKFYRCISGLIVCVLSLSLVFSPTASYAQSINLLNLPIPGTMISPSPAFVPVLLKGMTIHPDDPLKFDFIIDSGNTNFTPEEIKNESERLVKYFLASMTVPKDDLWVNLSPYENDRIIPEELGKTELGRDMLAQDYILKQLTASLMYPEEELGEKFWDKVYQKAEEQFGTTEIPVNTFNKVWILPESATVYEHEQTVYVVDAHLKVMLDSDYQAMQYEKPNTQDSNLELQSSVIKEIIIPEIEREVNEGQHFAPLRQIYHSLILAKWYKETIKNSLLAQVYVDKNMTDGVESEEKDVKDKIYAQYMEAYKKGVFNYIKEDYDRLGNEMIPRKYFSGGIKGDIAIKRTSSPVIDSENPKYRAEVGVTPEGNKENMLTRLKKMSKTAATIALLAALTCTGAGCGFNEVDDNQIMRYVELEDGKRQEDGIRLKSDENLMRRAINNLDNKQDKLRLSAEEELVASGESAVSFLIAALDHSRRDVRMSAKRILRDKMHNGVLSVLLRELKKAKGGTLRANIELTVQEIRDRIPNKVIKRLIKQWRQSFFNQETEVYYNTPFEHEEYYDAIIDVGEPATFGVVEFLSNSGVLARMEAKEILIAIGAPSLPALYSFIKDGQDSEHEQLAQEAIHEIIRREKLDQSSSPIKSFEEKKTDEWLKLLGDTRGQEYLSDREFRDTLKEVFDVRRMDRAITAIKKLEEMKDDRVVDVLIKIMKEPFYRSTSARLNVAAIRSLVRIGDRRAVAPLMEELDRDHWSWKWKAFILESLEKLGASGDKKASDYMDDLESESSETRLLAINRLVSMKYKPAQGKLLAMLDNINVAETAAKAIISIGGSEAETINSMLQLLRARLPSTRQGFAFNFLGEAVKYRNEDYDFVIEYSPRITKTTPIIYTTGSQGPDYESDWVEEVSAEVLKIHRGKLLSSSPLDSKEKVGGIDLNEIDVDRQGAGVDIQFDPIQVQELIDMGITGFAPVIINLTPLPSVLPLLGLAPQREEEFEVSSLN